jgi:hypothetical protein
MKNSPSIGRPGRRKKDTYKPGPNREQIDKAIEDFLKKGGKIQKIETEESQNIFLPYNSNDPMLCIEIYA